MTPEDLAARAAANGVELWALTDHDEIGGQHRAAAAARQHGMKYLTGTEISVTFAGATVHIVGLGFDPDDAAMRQGLADTRGGRGARAMEMADQLAKVGIKLTQVNLDWNQWLSDVFTNKDYDLTIISHVEPFDIGIYADPNYYFGYNDPDFQAIMKQLNETTDEAARKELLIAAQKRLAEQAVNGYLFELAQTGVWSAKLEGMWQNAPVEGVVLSGIRWTE